MDDFAENGGPDGSIWYYYGVAPTDIWFDQGFRSELDYNGKPGDSFFGQRQDVESTAIFGEFSYELSDTLTFTAGGRWFSTDHRLMENSLYLDTVFDDFDVEDTTEEFSPRVNLAWRPTDNVMAYATYSEGVRIGGQNGGVTQNPASLALGAPQYYDGDKLKNHELGVKSTLADGRVIANLSAFVMDWEDYQIRVSLPVAGATTVNAGNASIDGFEGQFAFKPTENWEFSTAFTYLDATIDDDISLNNGMIVAGEAGDDLPAVPELKASASLLYTTELNWGDGLEGAVRLDHSYVGDSVNATNASILLFGAEATVPATQPSYAISDLTFSVSSDNGWEAWLSVNNLADERAITYIWPRFADDRVFTVRPRELRVGFYKSF